MRPERGLLGVGRGLVLALALLVPAGLSVGLPGCEQEMEHGSADAGGGGQDGGGGGGNPDGGAAGDAGPGDAGMPCPDAGPAPDASVLDGGLMDGGVMDGGLPPCHEPDAGMGLPDAAI